MHSPPVHPSDSITSGTGSVSTMCEEVTVSRDLSCGSARTAPPTASTAPPASRLRRRAAQPPHARALEHQRAALDQPAAQAEGQPGRLERGEVGDEHAAAKEGGVAAGANL